MGCDIHLITEIKVDNKWILSDKDIFKYKNFSEGIGINPFEERNYSVFALLANVRNDNKVIPISLPKGLPDDSEYLNFKIDGKTTRKKDFLDFNSYEYHSHSYLTLKEILEYDYSKINISNQFRYEEFYEDLELLKTLGEPDNVRIVFWFDN